MTVSKKDPDIGRDLFFLLTVCNSAEAPALVVHRGNIADGRGGIDLFDQLQQLVHIGFLIENQVGKFLLSMDQDQPVIVVGRAVVGLALTDAAEGPIDVVVST